MFFKKWFLVNRFIVLDFYSNNFFDRGGILRHSSPSINSAF
ncbi:hypothetical protein HMPREF1436_01305 [Helicobacter pylori GAMchJs136i]|nr:hypothetical protein HMPREF1436_01305 [Helicobacter pylori GAMchJs136i]